MPTNTKHVNQKKEHTEYEYTKTYIQGFLFKNKKIKLVIFKKTHGVTEQHSKSVIAMKYETEAESTALANKCSRNVNE